MVETSMTPDLKRLRELAEKATPGPWAAEDMWEVITTVEQDLDTPFPGIALTDFRGSSDLGNDQNDLNAQFIAAANPQAILSLLDRLEAVERERCPDWDKPCPSKEVYGHNGKAIGRELLDKTPPLLITSAHLHERREREAFNAGVEAVAAENERGGADTPTRLRESAY